MSWLAIGKFLDRFSELKPARGFMQEEAAKAIKNILNVEIKQEEIEWRAGILYIKIKNQVLKNEIFLKKEKILEMLKQRLSSKSPVDIRF